MISRIQKRRANKGVLVIYTGGTIGSAPRHPGDPESPQYVVPWEELAERTPELETLRERGCKVASHSFGKLDSCNVTPDDWGKMARVIYDKYDEYEGFVILHGTDTMVYTASALSFMLQDLAKPVVLTGAQRSALVDVRNDATQNFIAAIEIANPRFSGLPLVPEVTIFFGGTLLRGNRTIKDDTSGYTAYRSPNLEPLGEGGDRIVINERVVRPRPPVDRRFRIRTRLDASVLPLFVYPGITDEVVESLLSLPGLRAVIVQAFGSGNIPTYGILIGSLRKAREERGIIVATVSQCRRGPVELGIYETSAALLEAGLIAGGDIGIEAAQCKLMVLLGDPDADLENVERDYQRSLAGEQSTSQYVTRFGDRAIEAIREPHDELPVRLRLPGQKLSGEWNPKHIERALLRFRHAKVTHAHDEAVDMRIFADLGPEEELTDTHPSLIGSVRKWPMAQPGLVVFDVSSTVRSIVEPGERVSFTLALDTPASALTARSADLVLIVRESGD